ncbi:MAG: hypothetical protein ACTS2F_29330 [Thainema sp.]
MSAVPKPQYSDLRSAQSPLHVVPDVPSNLFQGNAQPAAVPTPTRVSPSRRRQSAAVIESFPTPRSQPKWLQALFIIQQATTITAWGLGVSVLGLYGWTVYSQQVWSQNYDRLSQLQRSEEQMLSAIEGLKEQATVQAASANLQPATPSTTIPLISATHAALDTASMADQATPSKTESVPSPDNATASGEANHQSSTSPAQSTSKTPFIPQSKAQSKPQPAETRAQLPNSLGY